MIERGARFIDHQAGGSFEDQQRAAFISCRARYRPPISRSCGVSIGCIWSSHSPGSRMLRRLPASEEYKIGRRHVRTLMRRMGIEALYRRPRQAL
jgi:hypothetical protein